MRKEYDLSDATRGPVLKPPGKERITILLDKDILAVFRERVSDSGRGYQTAINQALRDYLASDALETTLRRVVREELRKAG
ncbi:MAG: BrnA antitoxin family protein [Gammaproteobacteria bacterium]|nr:BrnA antitoxin family protein [Gammaproteobacteria bacterium]